MSTRRGFLKMLGVVGASSVAGEHLSYLIRQPSSIIMPGDLFVPYTTILTFMGITGEDRVFLQRMDGSAVWDSGEVEPARDVVLRRHAGGIKIEGEIMEGFPPVSETHGFTVPYVVEKPGDENIMVVTRRHTAMPYENFFAPIKQEGRAVAYDAPMLEEFETHPSVHRQVHAVTDGLAKIIDVSPIPTPFDDL